MRRRSIWPPSIGSMRWRQKLRARSGACRRLRVFAAGRLLRSKSQHRHAAMLCWITASLPSPLEEVGESDMTAHVEWTNLAERAERRGLHVAGLHRSAPFPHRSAFEPIPELASARSGERARALQTLLHPEFPRGQIPVLARSSRSESLGGFKFRRIAARTVVRRERSKVSRSRRREPSTRSGFSARISDAPLKSSIRWMSASRLVRYLRPLSKSRSRASAICIPARELVRPISSTARFPATTFVFRFEIVTVADVDGVFLDRERGFLDRFAQGRVGVNGAAKVFAASAEFHHRDDFGDQFGGGVGKNRRAENAIGLCIGDELDHAFDVLVG